MSFGNRTTKGCTFRSGIVIDADVYALLAACKQRGPAGVRDRALLGLGVRCGPKTSELLDIQPEDIEFERSRIRIGRGRRRRYVALDDPVKSLLKRWIARRGEEGLNGCQYLFVTIKETKHAGKIIPAGNQMSGALYRAMIKRRAKKAGIAQAVRPNVLRNTCLVNLVHEGVPIKAVAEILGYKHAAAAAIAYSNIVLDYRCDFNAFNIMQQREWDCP